MLPTLDEALNELKTAEKRNPGPWVKHSMNVGVAARNIAEKIPGMDPKKALALAKMMGATPEQLKQIHAMAFMIVLSHLHSEMFSCRLSSRPCNLAHNLRCIRSCLHAHLYCQER